MPRAVWSGSISFGLVNVPVRMYVAIDEQDVHFHLLHEKDVSRIGYDHVCKKEGTSVPDDELVRGHDVSDGTYVYLTDEDLEAAAGESYRSIDLQDFVDMDDAALGPRPGISRIGRRSASATSGSACPQRDVRLGLQAVVGVGGVAGRDATCLLSSGALSWQRA